MKVRGMSSAAGTLRQQQSRRDARYCYQAARHRKEQDGVGQHAPGFDAYRAETDESEEDGAEYDEKDDSEKCGDERRRIGEIRTVERILRFQYREHFFPVIFIEWLFKCRDKEYQCLYRHGHKQDLVTIRQMQQLEQGADNNDGGTPAITEIQYPLAFFTGEVHFYSVLYLLYFPMI